MAEVGALHPLPQAFCGKEREWYRGLVVLGEGAAEQVVPMVEPEAFLSRKEAGSVLADALGETDR
jgi:hypothetical protein